ncbi:cation tolerance protein [Rickettsia conorii subsp. heilongjiangensis]|uniref:Cation tolerance protein n=1 Tax=Rickettsia conorii subsp. heilongjiangensis TaxID=226665 RepID=A0AAD1LSQ9_RICCR|nr:cation tolerance protein [Rickettsia conorii subsp. heilongjiangensis]BBM92709.1 cation tolerance protein [Rickettsia conorii subsp. heilongjiangensis]BBM93918.1 cation tolerance protein [Rickettsia conorii subsp. heilongjiangensis]BBM95127.1 cation tolerance protein [Rickettsia conorii subsp. heilongjiangensis]
MNLKKSKESANRGAEHIINIQHPRTYKDDVANFSSSSSIFFSPKTIN